ALPTCRARNLQRPAYSARNSASKATGSPCAIRSATPSAGVVITSGSAAISLSCQGLRVTVTFSPLKGKKNGADHRRPRSIGQFVPSLQFSHGIVSPSLVQQWLDQLGKARARPVQAALHRAQVHTRDLRNLLVALALELTQTENQ